MNICFECSFGFSVRVTHIVSGTRALTCKLTSSSHNGKDLKKYTERQIKYRIYVVIRLPFRAKTCTFYEYACSGISFVDRKRSPQSEGRRWKIRPGSDCRYKIKSLYCVFSHRLCRQAKLCLALHRGAGLDRLCDQLRV